MHPHSRLWCESCGHTFPIEECVGYSPDQNITSCPTCEENGHICPTCGEPSEYATLYFAETFQKRAEDIETNEQLLLYLSQQIWWDYELFTIEACLNTLDQNNKNVRNVCEILEEWWRIKNIS